MASTAKARLPATLHRRRIIERPRLLASLDESKTRVKVLVAPAGYGKSTLADQWVTRDGRKGVWFTARRSSTDVAGLALGLARASTEVVPECDARLRAHLRALPAPAENVEVLAEILGEDVGPWPPEAWLVLDEYEHLTAAPDAERFVATLVAESPIQLVVATRQRPAWVTRRTILYGEVFELDKAELAMDDREAAEVLADRSAQSTASLVTLANGWPAVIGLASVSTAEIETDHVPESLYQFFAEEVFAALGEDVQAGLAILAVAPILDRELAATLLGAEEAEAVCSAALDVGILVERSKVLELHPLARSFLEERRQQLHFDIPVDAAARCLSIYRKRREWDAALDVIAKHGLKAEVEHVLVEALDDLLDTARLSSIEHWLALAREFGLEQPIFALARAEVALRFGRCAEARIFAEAAASSRAADVVVRALLLAGRAAHLSSREESALEFFDRAAAAARTESERRDALWGQLLCSIELELPGAADALRLLHTSMNPSDLREAVRAASGTMNYTSKFGLVDPTPGDSARELLDAVSDPLVVSGFQSTYSAVLSLLARYDEAHVVASDLLATARRYRLDFAVPYALNTAALAHAGMRQWSRAYECCREASLRARAGHDVNAEQLSYAAHIRILAQQGKHPSALAVRVPPLEPAVPSTQAELQCSRALLFALSGRVGEARSAVDECRGLSRAVEAAVLGAAVDAICALKSRGEDAIDAVAKLQESAFSTGAVDLLVTAYRSCPALLTVLLRSTTSRDRFVELLERAHDEDLASAAGYAISLSDPRALLTPREHEVFELLCQGLTNLQIAKALFIEESTVKVHAHHIYDKLGVRSRTALAVQAALVREDQATSAIDVTAAGGDS